MSHLGKCRVALVLAGGNALGAYQAGVYETLHEHGIEPDWIVGTSAGAINGAVIAGNAVDDRVSRLRSLWRPKSDGDWPMWWDAMPDTWRRTNDALGTMLVGHPGLFGPIGSAIGGGSGVTPAMYDTAPLSSSLAQLVNFDRLNDGAIRYGAVAVDLDSGDEAVFDTVDGRIGPDHVRASAAMPPNFPAVPIDDHLYVDGGLSANLPIDPVLAAEDGPSTLCIAVDLLPLAAPRPTTLGELVGRAQDLIFGCQSRRSIAHWRDVYAFSEKHRQRSATLVRLAYADQRREVAGKAMDFSPASVRARWDAGRVDGAALADKLKAGQFWPRDPGLTVHQIC
jgi:NTE family protein